ncbi:thioredoxin [Chryseobacterium sp. 6424]|uniref:thioredoxin family protein n=1 Tax=Chryseobacterium sp. 6424 TaxID=2039166 RepID=UPI000EFBB008|nr:thioredoxin family protein [Chryseobacterium sp. 6424]AYO57398.1 thioredoxin [Chryseobacterium sp. 6424]
MRTTPRWFLLAFFIVPLWHAAQLKELSVNELETVQKHNPRNTVLFIHTSWCQYCKAMMKTTFRNKEVVKLLNEHFHFIPFNAEERKDVVFRGKTYRFQPSGRNTGVHELAQSFLEDKTPASYPHLFILNPAHEIIKESNGFISIAEMLRILTEVTELNNTP